MIKKSTLPSQPLSNNKIHPAHTDLLQALNFAIMYRIYKEEQNIQPPKSQQTYNSTLKASTKSKKGAMFERPTKTKVNKSYQQPYKPQKKSQKSKSTIPIYEQPNQQFYFEKQQKHKPKPQNANVKSLNQFITELSTPTNAYGKMDESYVSHQNMSFNKSNPPVDRSDNQFDFSNVKLDNPNFAPVYTSSYNSNNYKSGSNELKKYVSSNIESDKLKSSSQKSKNYQKFEVKKKPDSKNRSSDLTHQFQKHSNDDDKSTQLDSLIKTYKQKLLDLESQKNNHFLTSSGSSQNKKQSYHIPQFATPSVKITDWTKKAKPQVVGEENESDYNPMYESQQKVLYQPSPTKSSSLTPENKKHKGNKDKKKKKASSSEESEAESEVSEEEKVTSVKNSKNKEKKKEAYKKQKHQTMKQFSPKSASTKQNKQQHKPSISHKYQPSSNSQTQSEQQKSYKATPHLSKKLSDTPKPQTYIPSPSPQQLPKPTFHKPFAPKIPYTASQKQICKFSSKSSSENEEKQSFDLEFKGQLQDISGSKVPKHLLIDMVKHKQHSGQEDEEEMYYKTKKVSRVESNKKVK